MLSTTRRRIAFAAIVAGGLVLVAVVDVVVRNPRPVIAIVLLAYVFTRPHLPFSYTVDELRHYHNPVAGSLNEVAVPVALLGAIVLGAAEHWSDGPVVAVGRSLIFAYVVDRLVAFAIRSTVRAWLHHQYRRRAAAAAAGDVVDVEVLP